MTLFPKKYNYKNIKKRLNPKKSENKLYSKCLSLDQNIHPGALFSIFFQDYYSQIQAWFGPNIEPILGFSPSSKYYSNLNKSSTDLRKLHLDAKKQFKKNIKFLDKLGFSYTEKADQSLSIDFYIFVREFFSKLYDSQKIFVQKEILFWDKEKQTNIASSCLQAKKEKAQKFTLKYFIEAKGVSLLLETDTIETIFADVAVAVNPQDKRYKKLIGQNVIIPIVNKNIPIIGDESVDPFTGSGVIRVTPGHDELGLELAKKHNLPTDIFAIDTDGNFTKHAGEFTGKPLKDFYDNILKYIDDIGNLDSKIEIKKDFFYDNKSGTALSKIALNQWNIKHDYAVDYLIEQVNTNQITIQSEDIKEGLLSSLESLSYTAISTKSSKGLLIPILKSADGQNYTINENVLLDYYKNSRSRKDFTMSAIVLNLILNNQLKPEFAIEDLIDVLFDLDFSKTQTILLSYIELYDNCSNSTFRDGYKSLKRLLDKIDDDVEKIKILGEILEDSFAFIKNGEYYKFDFSTVFNLDKEIVLQQEDSFNKEFLDLLLFMFHNKLPYNLEGSFTSITTLGNTFIGLYTEKDYILKLLILSLEYSKILPFSNLFFHPSLVLEDDNIISNYNSRFLVKEFSDILETYGPDVLRLLLLLSKDKDKNLIFDMFDANGFKRSLDKIWNAYRYIYSNLLSTELKLADIQNNINNNITDYDSWILHGFKALLGEIKYQIQEGHYTVIGKKILNFITNDLCDKYLESLKFFTDSNTGSVAVFVFINSLSLLKAIAPLFAQELGEMCGVEGTNFNILASSEIHLSDKNYKINIFMEMVDKIRNIKIQLGLQKHEVADIFVQANQDFVDFLAHNQDLFQRLTNTGEILYLRLHEDLPLNYQTDTIININIGAKKPNQPLEITKDSLSILLEELESKKEHLHHMKSLMASVSFSLSPELLFKKKSEIQSLQDEIDYLELQISKLKIKN